MSLLFVDGFDHYATADVTKKWNGIGITAPTIVATDGRRNSGRIQIPASSSASKLITQGDSFVVGFAFRFQTTLLNARKIAAFFDSGTTQCELRLNTNGTLSVTRNGTALTNGTSTTALTLNVYDYIEWKVTIANSISAGSCVVRINGVDVIDVAAGQDLQNTANAYANQFTIGNDQTGAPTVSFDDLYICNQSGSTNNNFLGDCRVDTLYPDADGFYTDGTPSAGSDHYAMVDETPVSTSDYVTLASLNDRDSYSFTSLPALAGQVVYGVQAVAAVDKNDSGLISAATFARSGSSPAVNQDGASTALSTTYTFLRDIYEQNPDTSTAWDRDSVNAAEFGVVVTA
jgi:hypothetical protein